MSETAEVHNVPGSVLDCFCPKCENTTEHTIVSASKRRVREVRCEACKFVHKYSAMKKSAKPAKTSKPAKALKAGKTVKAAKPARRGRRKKSRAEGGGGGANEWEREMEEKKDTAVVDYRLGGSYAEGTVIRHPSFGVGFVKKIISGNKFEALFKGGRKFLVQNIKR
jgi:ribosomal protein L44E